MGVVSLVSKKESQIQLAKNAILKAAQNHNWEVIIQKNGGRLKLAGRVKHDISQVDGLGDSEDERECVATEAVHRLLEDKLICHQENDLYRLTKSGRNAVLEPDRTEVSSVYSAAGEFVADGTRGFWSDIHSEVVRVAQRRFESGHFADAVEAAFKEVNSRVKELVKSETGEEFDGAKLMNRAFSVEKPLIVLGDLATETGRSIQQGYMQLFAGAMTGIRNPKAHANIEIDERRAVNFLHLASLLMCKLDERVVQES